MEVIVAVVLLTVGVLGLAAMTEAASRMLRQAAVQEAAATAAGLVLDSLLETPAPSPGERREGELGVAWRVSGGAGARLLLVDVWLGEDTLGARWQFAALHTRPPAALGG